jgi:5'-phosphate synthase pdxT subunit
MRKGEARIGVLALQGAFEKHIVACTRCGANALPLRYAEELADCDGLIIPGGESTTVGTLLAKTGLGEAVKARAAEGMPVMGTCMGMIVMATKVVDYELPTLGLLDVEVKRNAFGRQIESFESPLKIEGLEGPEFPGVFIRAPVVTKTGKGVEVMARLNRKIVFVRQGNLLGLSFHPELTDDLRVHRLFLSLVG